MQWLIERIREPSSHAGFAALLQAAKFFFPAWGAVIDAATALFGALAVTLAERK